MRISDGSSDVCSSDLGGQRTLRQRQRAAVRDQPHLARRHDRQLPAGVQRDPPPRPPGRAETVGWVERSETHRPPAISRTMGFASLYPSYEDGAGAGGSRQKRLSPSSSRPMPPSIEPSPRSLPPFWGAAASMRPAMRENGSDCSQTVPGPVSVARNMPSPPHTTRLIPPPVFTSITREACVSCKRVDKRV